MIEVPDRLRNFPFYKGMLVHFTVFVGDDGIPDFKVVHEVNRIKCMQGKLCALCGQKLDKEMVFIGGEGTIKQSVFVDGPMDLDCALYSTKVCPYLRDETWEHAKQEARHKGQPGVVFKEFKVPIGHPKMGMYFTDGYKLIQIEDQIYYYANEPTKVDWTAMPQPKE